MADIQVWLVHAPVEIAEIVEKNQMVAVGWAETGDLSSLHTREKIKKQKYELEYLKRALNLVLLQGSFTALYTR